MLSAELAHTVGALELALHLEVPAGRCLALAGPSGAGKTTLLRLLAGTRAPKRGRISVDGATWVDTETGAFLPPERRRCGYVYQDYALFPHLSAWRNVAYGLSGLPRRDRRSHAIDLLDRFGLAERAEARPATLSGGERQRVALARALACDPTLLLLDEPLAALDRSTRTAAARELGEVIAALEVPAVLVTHDFAEAAQLGHEVGIIAGGRIVQRGSASDLAAAPATVFVADFTGAVVLHGTAAPGDGLTRVQLDGGGAITSVDTASGRVAASVFPWEITLSPATKGPGDSAQNHLRARVTSITTLGNRARVGLQAGQPFAAEITGKAASDLQLKIGAEVSAGFKATATRLVAL